MALYPLSFDVGETIPMTAVSYTVAPEAKIPFALLTSREKTLLPSIFAVTALELAKRTPSGHFVSRLGQTKRVLWDRNADTSATIRGILDNSYNAA